MNCTNRSDSRHVGSVCERCQAERETCAREGLTDIGCSQLEQSLQEGSKKRLILDTCYRLYV